MTKATHSSLRRVLTCNSALASLSPDAAPRPGNGHGDQYAGHEEFGPQQISPSAGLCQNRNRFSSRPGAVATIYAEKIFAAHNCPTSGVFADC